MADVEVADVDWSTFDAGFRWRQGEHVSLIGPTRLGKTTLAFALAQQRRKWSCGLITKPRDSTFTALGRNGWKIARDWPPPPLARHVLLWPRFRHPSDADNQARVFDTALGQMFTRGAWCVIADEIRYMDKRLGLAHWFELYWLQGSAMKLSLMALTQRPAHVPLEVYDQATHLFFFRDNDDANLKRIGGVGWLSSRTIREAVASLEGHDVLYVNARTGELTRTRYVPESRAA